LIFELACLGFETKFNFEANIDPGDCNRRSLVADRFVDSVRTPEATRFFSNRKIGDNLNEQTYACSTARPVCMAERRPVYSGQAAKRQIGYIKDDEAFDLFDRRRAVYEENTGLLRDPKSNAVVGYVSFSDIFVGSSWMAQELFCNAGPVPPMASLKELEDENSDAPVCVAEDVNAEIVDTFWTGVQAPRANHTANTEPSEVHAPIHSENANLEDHAAHATDVAAFAGLPPKDEVGDTALPTTSSPHLEAPSAEQPARPQDASDVGEPFASGERGADYEGRTEGDIAPVLQPDVDAPVPAPSDESAFESAQPGEPSGGDGMPPAVEAFMRHLTEYLHSSNHQTAMLSLEATGPRPSANAEVRNDADRAPFSGEPDLEGELSGTERHSELAVVAPEQTEDCLSVGMENPVEMAPDNRQERNSSGAENAETNDASPDIVSTDMDRGRPEKLD
jgi:hypothetical protein